MIPFYNVLSERQGSDYLLMQYHIWEDRNPQLRRSEILKTLLYLRYFLLVHVPPTGKAQKPRRVDSLASVQIPNYNVKYNFVCWSTKQNIFSTVFWKRENSALVRI